jgi:hypothetical protein
MTDLSILIPTVPERKGLLADLVTHLRAQGGNVEILTDNGPEVVGVKRNRLLSRAKGKGVAFVDDDDWVVHNYIALLLEGIEMGVDCCSLTGEITTNGLNPRKFIHSIQYDSYFEKEGVYYRPPNHLNCIKAEIAKQFLFPETNCGEDTDWAMQIAQAKALRTEHRIDQTIYYYRYSTTKTLTQ